MVSVWTIAVIVACVLAVPFAALGVLYLAAYLVPNHMRAIRTTLRIPLGVQTVDSAQPKKD